MDKTYYDILEVSRYATDEVINRAHKVLVKRYHPDLQQDEESRKKAAKEMIKVNEAYEVLSNKEKKAKYDRELEQKEQREKVRSQNVSQSQNNTRNNANNINRRPTNRNLNRNNVSVNPNDPNNNFAKNPTDEEIERQRILIEKQGNEIREKMRQNYYNQLRQMGYTIKTPFTFKKFLRIVMVIAVIALIGLITFNVPFFANKMSELEFSNPILAVFIRILRSIFLIRKV